jgi:hypothetical protein
MGREDYNEWDASFVAELPASRIAMTNSVSPDFAQRKRCL